MKKYNNILFLSSIVLELQKISSTRESYIKIQKQIYIYIISLFKSNFNRTFKIFIY